MMLIDVMAAAAISATAPQVTGYSKATTPLVTTQVISDGIKVKRASKVKLQVDDGSGWGTVSKSSVPSSRKVTVRTMLEPGSRWRVVAIGKGRSYTTPARQFPLADVTTYAVGDMVVCGSPDSAAVADMVHAGSAPMIAAGDLAYPVASPANFTDCYNPLYGDIKASTMPVPGNHEYMTKGAAGYFGYFDGIPKWYTKDVDGWRYLFLNSNCDQVGGCDVGSEQYTWLQEQLDSSATKCMIAVDHHPRWSSNHHGNNPDMGPMYKLMANRGVDALLSGHDHGYERFARLDADAKASAKGIRQFVLGTGGGSLYSFGAAQPGSQVRVKKFGLTAFTTTPDGYSWTFVDTAGKVRDSGTDSC